VSRGRPWITFVAATCVVVVASACGGAAGPPTQTRSADTIGAAPATAARTAASAGAATSPVPAAAAVPQPVIHQWPIPFGPARKRQMAAYSLRHYGEDTYRLASPKVIVEHYTETATAQEAYNTFAPDVADSEFHELPNTCAHFLVEASGRIDQLVPLSLRCRHTVGLNWTAVGIEHVGFSDREILGRPAQMAASLALTRWLRCRLGIPVKDVIGHNESLSSPYHRELVPSFAHQTHSDWSRPDMQIYRARLARRPCR
jgi:N-acetylmuramoyl-L-alanine amidase